MLKVKQYLYSLVFRLQDVLAGLAHRNRFFAALFYILVDHSFLREQMAVLSGRVKHLNETRNFKTNRYLLVRNVHRLEKGLLMRPRREIFAKDYIEETVDTFEALWNGAESRSDQQLKWSRDVLHEYFRAISVEDDIVDLHRRRFQVITNGTALTNGNANSPLSVPYESGSIDRCDISYDDLYKLSRQRRSTRWFLNKPVSRDLIDKAMLVANQSPSACNRQPYEFRVFDEPEKVLEISQFPMGTVGFAENIPVIVVVVGNLDAYFNERDRHLIYIDSALAAMSFMLALETLGLASCPINWPDIEVRERMMEKALGLKAYQRPIMCIGLGYPDPEGKIAFSEKRQLGQIRNFNNYKK